MTLIDEIQHDIEQHPLDRNPAVMARALELIEKDEALLRQALEALGRAQHAMQTDLGVEVIDKAVAALRERLK